MSKTRYNAINVRGYNYLLELYFFKKILNGTTDTISAEEFQNFTPDAQLIDDLRRAKQISTVKAEFKYGNDKVMDIEEMDKAFDLLFEKFDTPEFKDAFSRSAYSLKWENFQELYSAQTQSCYFCKITKEEIDQLANKGQLLTKRLGTRGRSFEIDRIEPNQPYKVGNIALICYWCNNAKSDEFSEDEFKPIAEAIGIALRNRLLK